MKSKTIIQLDDYRTLPLMFAMARTTETIPAFGCGKAEVVYVEPNYEEVNYDYSVENLSRAGSDCAYAREAIVRWSNHQGKVGYYLQFHDDPTGDKLKRFHSHTELVSAILDSRLAIPTDPLWDTFQFLLEFKFIQEAYRRDEHRDANYEKHAEKLDKLGSQHPERAKTAIIIGRALAQLETRAASWSTLPPIHNVPPQQKTSGVSLFYSYSHTDELLRDELAEHLSALQRNRYISQWHDRRIGPGEEWKGSIDAHLNSADLILLLVSSDFLASDYCYDIEMGTALSRHDSNESAVIPIFLRPCDWQGSPIAKLQGLPKDAKAVTTWNNQDEAFTEIAKGIREAVTTIQKARSADESRRS